MRQLLTVLIIVIMVAAPAWAGQSDAARKELDRIERMAVPKDGPAPTFATPITESIVSPSFLKHRLPAGRYGGSFNGSGGVATYGGAFYGPEK